MFGLYEVVIRSLLVESKIDSLSRQIVKDVITACKQNNGQVKARMQIERPSFMATPDDEGIISLVLVASSAMTRVDTIAVSGSWVGAKQTLNLLIKIGSTTGEMKADHLSMIQSKCYETVRHELEHSMQSEKYTKHAIQVNKEMSTYGNVWEDPEALEAYFASPAEVEAYVAGIYHAAKRQRVPFVKYADTLINRYVAVAKKAGARQSDVLHVMDKVRAKWFAYAEKRFPNATLHY